MKKAFGQISSLIGSPEFLGLSLVLSTMTKLRIVGLPVGPGELMLMLFISACVYRRIFDLNRDIYFDRGLWRAVTAFWVISLTILAYGAWATRSFDVGDSEALHSGLAYIFVALVSISIAYSQATSPSQSLLVLTRLAVWVCAISWLWAIAFRSFAGLPLWEELHQGRFTGLSFNPNQIALLIVGLPFLLLYYLRQAGCSTWTMKNLAFMIAGAAALAGGWATGSGALRVSWVVCVPLVIALLTLQRSRGEIAYFSILSHFLFILALSAVLVYVFSYDSSISNIQGNVYPRNADRLYAGSAWAVRLDLWRHAWSATLESPILGLGPGAFSGITGPFEGSEAHNSLIDWVSNTGLLGGALIVALSVWALYGCAKSREYELLCVLVSILIFSMAHHILRHPLVWTILILAAHVSSARKNPR